MNTRRPATERTRGGFTLVEVLVTIAIVIVLAVVVTLISRRMVDSAKSAQCVSHLRELAVIIQTEVGDRGAYPPVISHETDSNGGLRNKGDDVGSLTRNYSCVSCPAAKYAGVNKNGDPISAYGANPMVMGNKKDGNPAPLRPASIRRQSQVILMADGAQFGPQNPRALGFSFRWHGTMQGNPEDADEPLTEAEIPPGGFWDKDVATLPLRHGGKANVLFCDGHVETIGAHRDLKQGNLYWNY